MEDLPRLLINEFAVVLVVVVPLIVAHFALTRAAADRSGGASVALWVVSALLLVLLIAGLAFLTWLGMVLLILILWPPSY